MDLGDGVFKRVDGDGETLGVAVLNVSSRKERELPFDVTLRSARRHESSGGRDWHTSNSDRRCSHSSLESRRHWLLPTKLSSETSQFRFLGTPVEQYLQSLLVVIEYRNNVLAIHRVRFAFTHRVLFGCDGRDTDGQKYVKTPTISQQ